MKSIRSRLYFKAASFDLIAGEKQGAFCLLFSTRGMSMNSLFQLRVMDQPLIAASGRSALVDDFRTFLLGA
jgi:hypothetical protein